METLDIRVADFKTKDVVFRLFLSDNPDSWATV